MTLAIVTAVGTLLSLAFGIYKWIRRMKREERRIADEAQKQFDEGIASGDTSLITAAFSRMRKLKS